MKIVQNLPVFIILTQKIIAFNIYKKTVVSKLRNLLIECINSSISTLATSFYSSEIAVYRIQT